MPLDTLEPLFTDMWLHQRPRVASRKGQGTWRTDRSAALSMPYIEPNISGIMQSFIIVDRDFPEADRIAGRLGLPEPSWVAVNPHTTQGHISYNLSSPVALTDAAHRRPVNLLARVEQGLETLLDGDPGYTGGLTKNPLHPSHPTVWGGEDARYELKTLAKALSDLGALPNPRNPRKHVQRSSVGRNVALFDDTRLWAYKAVERYWGGHSRHWIQAVFEQACIYNESRIAEDFSRGPLEAAEVGYITKSVADWVWKNFTPESRAAYKTRRQADGRKGGLASGEARRRNGSFGKLLEILND